MRIPPWASFDFLEQPIPESKAVSNNERKSEPITLIRMGSVNSANGFTNGPKKHCRVR